MNQLNSLAKKWELLERPIALIQMVNKSYFYRLVDISWALPRLQNSIKFHRMWRFYVIEIIWDDKKLTGDGCYIISSMNLAHTYTWQIKKSAVVRVWRYSLVLRRTLSDFLLFTQVIDVIEIKPELKLMISDTACVFNFFDFDSSFE